MSPHPKTNWLDMICRIVTLTREILDMADYYWVRENLVQDENGRDTIITREIFRRMLHDTVDEFFQK